MIAVVFERLGPYHVARIRAAAAKMPLIGVEVYARDSTYAWDIVEGEAGGTFGRTCLFDNTNSSNNTTREIVRRMSASLDEIQPAAVAIPGWGSIHALAALKWCAEHRRPAVMMSESTAWDEKRRPWKEAVKRRLVGGFAAAGLVGGRAHADYLVELGIPHECVFTGYDAVDNHYFEERTAEVRMVAQLRRSELGLPAQYFLASNRFIEKKNLSRLLTAYGQYSREAGAGAWSLVLLGDGPLRESIVHQRGTLGLEAHVFLPGFKQYGELPAYYALAHGFVHASTTEQWGLVVNEAMASGLPVLVSNRCGCASDLVTEGENGWTFDPYDVQAIAVALKRLATLADKDRTAMGQAGRRRISEWSPDVFAQGLKSAVDAALSAPKPKITLLDRVLLRAVASRS